MSYNLDDFDDTRVWSWEPISFYSLNSGNTNVKGKPSVTHRSMYFDPYFELLWFGNSKGWLTSIEWPTMEKYSCFPAHFDALTAQDGLKRIQRDNSTSSVFGNPKTGIHSMLFMDSGLITASHESISFCERGGYSSPCIPADVLKPYTDQGFFSCMDWESGVPDNRIALGGQHSGVAFVDLIRSQIVAQYELGDTTTRAACLKTVPGCPYLVAASEDGKLGIIDRRQSRALVMMTSAPDRVLGRAHSLDLSQNGSFASLTMCTAEGRYDPAVLLIDLRRAGSLLNSTINSVVSSYGSTNEGASSFAGGNIANSLSRAANPNAHDRGISVNGTSLRWTVASYSRASAGTSAVRFVPNSTQLLTLSVQSNTFVCLNYVHGASFTSGSASKIPQVSQFATPYGLPHHPPSLMAVSPSGRLVAFADSSSPNLHFWAPSHVNHNLMYTVNDHASILERPAPIDMRKYALPPCEPSQHGSQFAAPTDPVTPYLPLSTDISVFPNIMLGKNHVSSLACNSLPLPPFLLPNKHPLPSVPSPPANQPPSLAASLLMHPDIVVTPVSTANYGGNLVYGPLAASLTHLNLALSHSQTNTSSFPSAQLHAQSHQSQQTIIRNNSLNVAQTPQASSLMIAGLITGTGAANPQTTASVQQQQQQNLLQAQSLGNKEAPSPSPFISSSPPCGSINDPSSLGNAIGGSINDQSIFLCDQFPISALPLASSLIKENKEEILSINNHNLQQQQQQQQPASQQNNNNSNSNSDSNNDSIELVTEPLPVPHLLPLLPPFPFALDSPSQATATTEEILLQNSPSLQDELVLTSAAANPLHVESLECMQLQSLLAVSRTTIPPLFQRPNLDLRLLPSKRFGGENGGAEMEFAKRFNHLAGQLVSFVIPPDAPDAFGHIVMQLFVLCENSFIDLFVKHICERESCIACELCFIHSVIQSHLRADPNNRSDMLSLPTSTTINNVSYSPPASSSPPAKSNGVVCFTSLFISFQERVKLELKSMSCSNTNCKHETPPKQNKNVDSSLKENLQSQLSLLLSQPSGTADGLHQWITSAASALLTYLHRDLQQSSPSTSTEPEQSKIDDDLLNAVSNRFMFPSLVSSSPVLQISSIPPSSSLHKQSLLSALQSAFAQPLPSTAQYPPCLLFSLPTPSTSNIDFETEPLILQEFYLSFQRNTPRLSLLPHPNSIKYALSSVSSVVIPNALYLNSHSPNYCISHTLCTSLLPSPAWVVNSSVALAVSSPFEASIIPTWRHPSLLSYTSQPFTFQPPPMSRLFSFPPLSTFCSPVNVSRHPQAPKAPRFSPPCAEELMPSPLPRAIAIDAEFIALRAECPIFRSDKGTRPSFTSPSQLYVARVSIVRGWGPMVGKPLLDAVVPLPPSFRRSGAQDYLTRFSGVHAADVDLEKSLKFMMRLNSIKRLIILFAQLGYNFIGHGMQKDFRVLGLYPPAHLVRDTVEIYSLSGQRRVGLKFLSVVLLGVSIQSEHESRKTRISRAIEEEISASDRDDGLSDVEDDISVSPINVSNDFNTNNGENHLLRGHDSVEDSLASLALYLKYQQLMTDGDSDNFKSLLREIYSIGYQRAWGIPSVEDLQVPLGGTINLPFKIGGL